MIIDDSELNFSIEGTLDVQGLMELLSKYPPNMKVLFTWESILVELRKENVYLSKKGILYLDADYNSYKRQYAKDPKENE
jgi:hypothetical protein